MKNKQNSEKIFWDKIADKFAKKPISDLESYKIKLEKTAKFLTPNMRLLELGCGAGGTALHHAANVAEVEAIDISTRMIEIAESKRLTAKVENVHFSVADMHTLNPKNGGYDAVLAMSLLQVVEDRDVALRKIRSILQHGGLLFTSTMCMGDNLKAFKFIAPIGKFFGLFPTVRVFTTKELSDSIEAAGFQILHYWKPGRNKASFFVARAC